MAEYVLLDMSGRERSKLVSILDYEWISIRHTKDARTADTSQFWNCREHWSGMIGVIVLAIKIIAIIREVINIIMELAGKRISC